MTAKRLSRDALGWTVLEQLVANNIDVRADQAVGAAAGAGIFSGDQCAKLGKALDSVRPLPPLWTAVDMGERWSMLDWTESIATGSLRTRAARNPGFELAARPLEAIDRNSVDWNAALRQINGDDDEIVNILKTPLVKDAQLARWVFDQRFAQIRAMRPSNRALARQPGESRTVYTQRVTDGILSVVLPSLWRADDRFRMGVLSREMARAVVAAAQYRAQKGKWPHELEDLTPQYLPQVPRKIFSATGTEFVRYRKTAAGICLYARGVPGSAWREIAIGVAPQTDDSGL
ncbi:MAG TPA: hypothetical protein VHX86_19360 [Tepidisphaeraceae bacterium]|jgi:hypothetical protein|nr:hypothetical protein [Tepidisphaeraceae bacterium]